MKTSQNNYLSIVLGRRILGYSQTQAILALRRFMAMRIRFYRQISRQMPNGNTFRAMMAIANGAKAV